MPHAIERITHPKLRPAFPPYPLATKSAGLVFMSGVRAGMNGAHPEHFNDIPAEGRTKQQGFGLVDEFEGQVSSDSWSVHECVDLVLKAAGSHGDQLLRQHVWQQDKRFFPCYEQIRKHWQVAPAPSSGLGVASISGRAKGWIGIDGIAVAPGENPVFPAREVVNPVNDKRLPSASHYSQAVKSGELLFTAGHIAIKTAEPGKPLVNSFDDIPPEGRFLATGRSHPDSRDGPIAAQTWYVYHELSQTLTQRGLSMSDVIHANVYLSDLKDFATFHRVHRHYFPDGEPTLCVTGFNEVGHRGCRIEIELTAAPKNGSLKRRRVTWPCAAPFHAPAALQAGPLLFCSGIVGLDSDGRLVKNASDLPAQARAMIRALEASESSPGLAAQCWAALDTLGKVLKQSQSGFERLVKTTVYLRDDAVLRTYETVRAEFISNEHLPAMEVVLVHGPGPTPDAHIQIEAIAIE
ncbi:MAG: hypothetical protein RLZZ123_1501 [Pseudomonadota bacterium]|jgi:enamine deaminase RidA (YjgF/YER057c/UK114 family)